MTDFICAYFGDDWTITARGFSSLKQAEKHGLYMMPTAGVFGFAVIIQGDDWWQVREDFSILPPTNHSIEMVEHNNFKVSLNIPSLQFV